VLLDGLPRTSHLSRAQADDEELYELLSGGPRRKPSPPALTEWTWEHEALAAIHYRLGELIHVTSGARKRPQIAPWPTPETAADRVRRRRAREAFEHVESVIRFV
jgi:hypothetical protein